MGQVDETEFWLLFAGSTIPAETFKSYASAVQFRQQYYDILRKWCCVAMGCKYNSVVTNEKAAVLADRVISTLRLYDNLGVSYELSNGISTRSVLKQRSPYTNAENLFQALIA